MRGSGRFSCGSRQRRSSPRRFNPLHCGAVVASTVIAELRGLRDEFQSPSLRGSGRFTPPGTLTSERSLVSIPFIAGQWSLPGHSRRARHARRMFQSPSLRGSGRFASDSSWFSSRLAFQSPSLRGSGRFRVGLHAMVQALLFQSPSLRGSGRFFARVLPALRKYGVCFNPLHCGAVVASRGRPSGDPPRLRAVSIPFIAGLWSLLGRAESPRDPAG